MNLHQSIPWELAYALRVLLDEHLPDQVYGVRDAELLGWEGPRVIAYSTACEVVLRYAAPEDATKRPPTADQIEIADLREQMEVIERRLKELGGAT